MSCLSPFIDILTLTVTTPSGTRTLYLTVGRDHIPWCALHPVHNGSLPVAELHNQYDEDDDRWYKALDRATCGLDQKSIISATLRIRPGDIHTDRYCVTLTIHVTPNIPFWIGLYSRNLEAC